MKLLPLEEHGIVKVIELTKIGIKGNTIKAFIIYKRLFDSDYKMKDNLSIMDYKRLFKDKQIDEAGYPEDNLDRMLLDIIKEEYPDLKLTNHLIRYDEEIQIIKSNFISGKTKNNCVIYLTPNIDIDYRGPQLNQYRIQLDLFINNNDEHKEFFNEGYFHSYDVVDNEEIKVLYDKLLNIKSVINITK